MKRLLLAALLLCACKERGPGFAIIGDAARGHAVVSQYGCTSCHAIPGVPMRGMLGPPLERIGSRHYLAGHIPNVPQNMILWIRFPDRLKPGTAMPNLGVDDRDGRDIAAYLYTLR